MAEKENIYGIKYEVNIEELKTSTSQAKQQIKLANAEFNKSKSTLENWGTSTEGVGAKIKQLNSILEAEKSKLANMKQAYNKSTEEISKYGQEIEELKARKEEAIAQYGKESQEVKNLEQEIAKLERKQNASISTVDTLSVSILNQEAKVNSVAKEIGKYNTKLSELEAEQNKTVSAMDKLKASISEQEAELQGLKSEYENVVLTQGKSSDEAQNLASKIRELNGNLTKSKSELSEVEQEADSLTDSLKDAGSGAEQAGDGFTIMKGALADVVASGIEFAISKTGELVGSLFELSEATEEYRTMSAKLEGSANTFGYSVEFAKDKYKELYGYLNDEQMATNAITNLMGLGASTDTVSDIVNSAIGVWSAYGDSIPIEGLTESINETAQVAKVTGSLADALNWAGISEDDFNAKLEKTNGTKERAQLIADTLNAKYGESKKTYDELTGSMTEANRAEAELKETQAQLGETVEPVNTAMTNLKTKALDMLTPGVEFLSNKMLDLLNYMKEHPAVMNAVTAVVLTLATAFGVLAGVLAIQGIITGVTKAFALLNTTLLANPIVLIITLITGLATGFMYLWNTSDGFRNFWLGLWEDIKTFCGNAVTVIVEFFTVTVPEGINNMITWFQELPGRIHTFLTEAITRVSEWALNMWQKAIETGTNFLNSIVQFFSQLPYRVGDFIGTTLANVINWAVNMWNKAKETGTNFLNSIVQFFSQLPGRVSSFISNTFSNVVSWASNMAQKAVETGSNFLNNVAQFISQLPGRVAQVLQDAISRVISWGAEMLSTGISAANQFVSSVYDTLMSLPGRVWNIGQSIVEGIWSGISGAAGWLANQVSSFVDGIVSGFTKNLKINSPSKVFAEKSESIPEGVGLGVKRGTHYAVDAVKNMTGRLLDYTKDKVRNKITVGYEVVDKLKAGVKGTIGNLAMGTGNSRFAYAGATTSTNNINFNQYNYSPKALDSLEVYRNTRKQLKQLKKWKGGN